jgi:hypothetical protein
MKSRPYTDSIHNFRARDHSRIVTGDDHDMSVQKFSSALADTDIAELVHPPDGFPVVTDLQISADGLNNNEAKQHKKYNRKT